jgi:hypothetical protein
VPGGFGVNCAIGNLRRLTRSNSIARQSERNSTCSNLPISGRESACSRQRVNCSCSLDGASVRRTSLPEFRSFRCEPVTLLARAHVN